MFIYLFCTILYLITALFKNKVISLLSTSVLLINFLLHTFGIFQRWLETHRTGFSYIPLANMFESLIFFSWSIALIYLIIEFVYKNKIIGIFASFLSCFSIGLTSIVPGISDEILPLIPALQSNWLTAHVTTCFLGYAGFALSFSVSIIYLLQLRRIRRNRKEISWLPNLEFLDQLNYKSVIIGFCFLTLGIITGSAWAHYAWGSYWSWDPKETWSLITWLIYAAFLHMRFVRGWKGEKLSYISIIGFIAVLFTFFGVNYLLVGLHSYASS